MKRRMKAMFWGAVLLVLLGIPIVVSLGRDGWWAFFLHHENPFTYIPETEEAIKETHASGERIVAALERWRAKTGRYPANLDELVPSDLASIPKPVVGNGKWSYTVDGEQEFQLAVWVGPDYESDWWTSGAKEWRVDR